MFLVKRKIKRLSRKILLQTQCLQHLPTLIGKSELPVSGMCELIGKSELPIFCPLGSQNYLFFSQKEVRTTYMGSQNYLFACGKLLFCHSILCHFRHWEVRTTYIGKSELPVFVIIGKSELPIRYLLTREFVFV